MLRSELELAARVHKSLLPRPLRSQKLDVDVRYIPVDAVGGDYCQVLLPRPSVGYITMCDVSGHGIGAALLATRISSEVRHWVHEDRKPAEIIQLLNAFVLNYFGDTGLLLSFSALRIDFSDSTASWSGAGHPGPIIERPGSLSSDEFYPLLSQHTLIGAAEEIAVDESSERSFQLASNDRLVFYTDGLTETRNEENELFGEERLRRAVHGSMTTPLFEVADHILKHVHRFRFGSIRDDMTLMVAQLG